MGITEKIAEIEAEMARTQKNKATEYHIGRLKARLSQLRSELLENQSRSSASSGPSFAVEKTGSVQLSLLGFPSVGKSSLLNLLTDTKSEVSPIDFCTLTAIPGNLYYNDVHMQLLDLPGIIEGASSGKGRGKEVLGVVRNSDCCIMMVDADKAELEIELLTREVYACGIRLNEKPPDVQVRPLKTGGVKIVQAVPLTKLNTKQITSVLQEFKMHNCEVLFREDVTIDQLIDVISRNRVYMPCVYVFNKIDQIVIEEVDRLAQMPHSVPISCSFELNLDRLLTKIWEHLSIVRVYTKPKADKPDFTEPVVLRKGGTVRHVCRSIHSTMEERFKYGVIWGASAKHNAQRVGLDHVFADEDVCTIVAR
ncbi:hypothetical protein RCL1_005446 [Eukaryota sp. TZLM3-RCL]